MKIPFEQVVTAHGATVLRVCRAALGGGPDADDAWSETFLSAFLAWPDLPSDANVQAWLVRIAQRKTIDVVRRQARQPIATDFVPDPSADGRTQGCPGPGDSDSNEGIWQEVAALPERQRLAIAYHYFGGLPHVETAALIGGTPESVRRAAADGLKTLRKQLNPVKEPKGAI